MCPAHSSASNLLKAVYKQTRKVNKPAENDKNTTKIFALAVTSVHPEIHPAFDVRDDHIPPHSAGICWAFRASGASRDHLVIISAVM